jgi:hypothetical protein
MFKQLYIRETHFKGDASFGITVYSFVHSCKDMLDVGPMDETFSFIT